MVSETRKMVDLLKSCKNEVELVEREIWLEKLFNDNKGNDILIIQYLPVAIFLLQERKRLVGWKFKDRVTYDKLKNNMYNLLIEQLKRSSS